MRVPLSGGQDVPVVLLQNEGVSVGDAAVGGGDINAVHLEAHFYNQLPD
jgi:hypothetical protein